MSIIRGETVLETVLLNAKREVLSSRDESFHDLVEEECRKAFQKGVEKGEKIGLLKGQQESSTFVDLLQRMAERVLEHKSRLIDQLRPEIVEFSMGVCERIIRRELSQPHVFAQLIGMLISVATARMKQQPLEVVVSPEDYAMLESLELDEVQFIQDPLMRRGDCRVESQGGLINYDISRELSELQAKVLQRQ